jgi:hypothetical protein
VLRPTDQSHGQLNPIGFLVDQSNTPTFRLAAILQMLASIGEMTRSIFDHVLSGPRSWVNRQKQNNKEAQRKANQQIPTTKNSLHSQPLRIEKKQTMTEQLSPFKKSRESNPDDVDDPLGQISSSCNRVKRKTSSSFVATRKKRVFTAVRVEPSPISTPSSIPLDTFYDEVSSKHDFPKKHATKKLTQDMAILKLHENAKLYQIDHGLKDEEFQREARDLIIEQVVADMCRAMCLEAVTQALYFDLVKEITSAFTMEEEEFKPAFIQVKKTNKFLQESGF